MYKYQTPVYTPFLAPLQQTILQELLPHFHIHFYGGANDATMQVACICFYEEALSYPIVLLKATYNPKYQSLSHRDLLGALMGLGIERDSFGDLIVQEDCLYVWVHTSVRAYVEQNLTQIGRVQVQFAESEDQVDKIHDLEEYTKIVATLRLDAIVAALTSLSREKAKMLIKNGLVKLNYATIEDVSKLCNNNSDISIRGYGRFIYRGVVTTTKKDNVVISVAKYR
ncbi:MAG: RNA-binding protein [Erysipelotrichaceae bacterium]